MPRTSRLIPCSTLTLLMAGFVTAAWSAATLPTTVELRQVGEFMIPFQTGLPIPTYDPQTRPKTELLEGWRMLRVELDHVLSLTARGPDTVLALEEEGRGAHLPDLDDRQWPSTALPSVANPPPRNSPSGVWYRRRLGVPPAWRGKRILLHCLAANYIADLWVNGKYVGYHEGGFTPFSFDVTDLILPSSGNTIAIRVDNPPWGAEGTVPWSQSLLPGGACDWWNATGVLRDIFLEAVPPASVVRVDVRTTSLAEGTKLRATVVLRNATEKQFAGQLAISVYPARVGEANLSQVSPAAIAILSQPVEVRDGPPASEITIAGRAVVAWGEEITLQKLLPWSPARPYLYVLEAVLRDEKRQVVDRLQTQFGARSLTVDDARPRLLLNGAPVSLAGVGRVEDDPQRGRAVSYRNLLPTVLDLKSAKWLGANFMRLGRGVNHPVTTLLADRLGLICWEEIPAAWLTTEAMQEQWRHRHIARQAIIEMISQDFNRPSVCFWGTGHMLAAGTIHRDFARDLTDIARFLDGTRLIGETALLDDRSPTQTEGDVVGYALGAAVSANQDALGEAVAVLDRRHRAQPTKPIIIAEFGAQAGGDESAWDRQVVAAQDVLRIFSARPYVAGCAWWSLADYLAPEGIRRTGIVTRDRRVTRPVARLLTDEFQSFLRRDGMASNGD